MNNIRAVERLNELEAQAGTLGKGSWHDQYKDSPYIFIGGLNFELTEGDIRTVFSQYGEVADINLVRDKETGAPKGFAFLAYADQRSTVLAVDNFNGITLAGRTIKVDHVDRYRSPEEMEAEREKKSKERTKYADMVTADLFANAAERREQAAVASDAAELAGDATADAPAAANETDAQNATRRPRTEEERQLRKRYQDGLMSEAEYEKQKKQLKKAARSGGPVAK